MSLIKPAISVAHGISRVLTLVALALLGLVAGCAAAPGSLLLSDETGSLDRAQVEAAATPLVARGAQVAVFVAARGDATGADLTRRLDAAGLLADGQIAPAALALYVSYEPRYSELRAGTRWSKRLPDAVLHETRTELLNPALRAEQLDAGVAATLQALAARGATPLPGERIVAGLAYGLGAGLVLVVLALSPLGARLGRWWRRSPPGRLAQRLGDQTPSGRRRLERSVRTARWRLEDRAAYARSWCRGAAAGPQAAEAAPLQARLQDLDQERAALAQAEGQGRTLLEAMDRLTWAYTLLGHEAARLTPARPQPKARPGKKRASAGRAFSAGASAPTDSTRSAPHSDSASTWDGGSAGDSGPSSDGGSW
jgi:hypothetical protein